MPCLQLGAGDLLPDISGQFRAFRKVILRDHSILIVSMPAKPAVRRAAGDFLHGTFWDNLGQFGTFIKVILMYSAILAGHSFVVPPSGGPLVCTSAGPSH